MTWLAGLLLNNRLVQGILAALAAVGAILLALGQARRSGRREGQAEAESEQRRETIEAVRRRDRATSEAPSTGDAAIERLRRGDG